MIGIKPTQGGNNPFKEAQVRHRRQAENPSRLDDIGEWIDFGRGESSLIGPRILFSSSCSSSGEERCSSNGAPGSASASSSSFYQGPMYTLDGAPGFLFLPQALNVELQELIGFAAVTSYCEDPHVTNIDSVPPKPMEENNLNGKSMWSLWKNEQQKKLKENKDDDDEKDNDEKARSRTKGGEGPRQTRWYRSFQKLSWATMGYHYDWTARTYHEDTKSEMPKVICDLAILFAKTAMRIWKDNPCGGGDDDDDDEIPDYYVPSACIVNYYHEKSIMGGHKDDLEYVLDKPIISLNTGLAAIFLLGGKTKDETPILPILVRPGDIMILGGESRLYYHGMARLLPHSTPIPAVDPTRVASAQEQVSVDQIILDDDVSSRSSEDENALQLYLTMHRININVRQVYEST